MMASVSLLAVASLLNWLVYAVGSAAAGRTRQQIIKKTIGKTLRQNAEIDMVSRLVASRDILLADCS